jgi:phage-related minor tail protein
VGFLKDAGDSLAKIGSIIVNKTEDYTRIARLNLEIKGLNNDILRLKAEVGALVLQARDEGKARIDLNSAAISRSAEKIADSEKHIEDKKKEIDAIKQKNSAASGEVKSSQ